MLWVVPSSQAQDVIPQVDIRLEAQPASVLDAPQTRQEFAGFLPIKGGYVLTHEHPQVAMSFGGNYGFAGRPGNYDPTVGIMDKGYAGSCGGCAIGGFCDHGEIKGTFAGHATGADMGDHGSFDAPKHNSFSHMRYATDWIKDAFNPKEDRYSDTRLKVMVAFAMDNEAMCESLYHVGKKNPTGAGGAGYECILGDSIQSLKRQIAAIKQWAKRERDWMRIAYTAQDIREIEKENKLAIIIGVEADYAWGAENQDIRSG